MKNNTPPFFVGQKVVYISDSTNGLKRNAVYQITNILIQPCGCFAFDIGLEKHTSLEIQCECCDCGRNVQNPFYVSHDDNFGFWISANDIRPTQELKAPMLTFEKIKEEEKEEILTLN